MTRPEWNTPPGGDFARYVEQLSARSLRQMRASAPAGYPMDDSPDEFPTPSGGALPPPVRPVASSSPGAQATAKGPVAEGAMRGIARSLAIGWAGLLLVMAITGTTSGALLVFVVGVWGAFQLRRWLLPPDGAAGLKAALDDMVRQQAAQKPRGKNKP